MFVVELCFFVFFDFEDVAGDDVVGFGESFACIIVGEEFQHGVVEEEFAADALFAEVTEGVNGRSGAFGTFFIVVGAAAEDE